MTIFRIAAFAAVVSVVACASAQRAPLSPTTAVEKGCTLVEALTDDESLALVCATADELTDALNWLSTQPRVVGDATCSPLAFEQDARSAHACLTEGQRLLVVEHIVARRAAVAKKDAGAS